MKGIIATLRRAGWPVLAALMFLGALFLLREELAQHSLESVWRAVADLPRAAIFLALALTVADYVALTGYEALGVRYAGKRLHGRRVALAATTGYAFSQGLGFPLLTGAPIRYRLYANWGLDRVDIARIVGFSSVMFWLGFLGVGGSFLLLAPLPMPPELGIGIQSPRALGLLMLLGAAVYWGASWIAREPIRIRSWSFPIPPPRTAGLQIGLGSVEWLLSASVLWALLPSEIGFSFPQTVTLFVIAHVAGMASHVPGGVGVFEAVVLSLLPAAVSEDVVLASLLADRTIFYLVPLIVGAVLLAVSEVLANRQTAEDAAEAVVETVSTVAPRAIAALTFLTGTILVLSGVVPISGSTREWLGRVMPLPLFELTHFAASLVGAALLVLARGLQRRLDGAYHVTLILVLLAMVLSVSHGFRVAAVAPLFVLAGVLFVSRREFHRRTSLLTESFTPGWIVATGLVLATSVWLGSLAYARVEYASEMWWTFAFNANAPRFLRSTVGAVSVLGLFAVARLLRPSPVHHTQSGPEVLDRIEPLVRGADRALAHLALLGDKEILQSDSQRSFIMYGIEGVSWVAMGDPVGDSAEFSDLAWRFRERVDQAGHWPVFYQVTPTHLPLYLELGLSLLKLGEEGHVPLADFSFDGPRRADLRKAIRRVEEVGGSFEVVPQEDVSSLIGQLRPISDVWLESRKVTEKGFSLGSFQADYVARQPVALVRIEGKPVAFANLWLAGHREFSADLMRYGPDAPRATMDYLFAKLIQWGQVEGFQRMGLGMAPFSGLEPKPLGPLWNRFGAALFRHGEHFYNFQGLRAYKEKFDPVWEPRFLASPAGLALPRVLADVASLIAGGLQGIVRK